MGNGIRYAFAITTLVATVGAGQAVELGQVDDFQNMTVQSWFCGTGSAPLVNISTGGPMGAGDRYLAAYMDISGTSARRAVCNLDQWSGNFVGAGITDIAMDVKNFGSQKIHFRLGFERAGINGPTDVAMSRPISVEALSGWNRITFSLGSNNMTALVGSRENALTNNSVMRLHYSLEGIVPPTGNRPSFGLNNITAVPEPTTMAVLGCAVSGLALRRRIKR